jgi:hypothetical protein
VLSIRSGTKITAYFNIEWELATRLSDLITNHLAESLRVVSLHNAQSGVILVNVMPLSDTSIINTRQSGYTPKAYGIHLESACLIDSASAGAKLTKCMLDDMRRCRLALKQKPHFSRVTASHVAEHGK